MAAADVGRILTRLATGLTVATPVALHILIVSGRPDLGLGLVALVSGLHAASGLISRRFVTAAVAGSLAGLCLNGLHSGRIYALYLPPIVVTLVLLFLFAESLRPGREAVITRLARVLTNEKSPEVRRYTRKVTWMWTVFFALMLSESALLAAFAPVTVWSLFVNVINYILMAGLFVAELAVRLLRFRQHSAARFFRALVRADLRDLADGGDRP